MKSSFRKQAAVFFAVILCSSVSVGHSAVQQRIRARDLGIWFEYNWKKNY